MANNNVIYNGAYSGALQGLASRWVRSESSGASGVQARLAAVAFATMLDSLIVTGSYSQEDAALLQSLCQGVWDGRMPLSAIPSDYADVAGSIVTLFTASRGGLEPSIANLGTPLFATLDTETEIVLSATPQTLIQLDLIYQPSAVVFWNIELVNATGFDGAPGAANFVLNISPLPATGFSRRGNTWHFSRGTENLAGKLGCGAATVLLLPDVEPGTPITLRLQAYGINNGAGDASMKAVAGIPPELTPHYMLVFAEAP